MKAAKNPQIWYMVPGVLCLGLINLSLSFQSSEQARIARAFHGQSNTPEAEWNLAQSSSFSPRDFGQLTLASVIEAAEPVEKPIPQNNSGNYLNVKARIGETANPLASGLRISLLTDMRDETSDLKLIGGQGPGALTQGAVCRDCSSPESKSQADNLVQVTQVVGDAARVARNDASPQTPAAQVTGAPIVVGSDTWYSQLATNCSDIPAREHLERFACHVDTFSQLTQRCESLREDASEQREQRREERQARLESRRANRLDRIERDRNASLREAQRRREGRSERTEEDRVVRGQAVEEERKCIRAADRYLTRLLQSMQTAMRISPAMFNNTNLDANDEYTEAHDLREMLIEDLGETPTMAARYLPHLMAATARGIHADAQMAAQICRQLNPSNCDQTMADNWQRSYMLANQSLQQGTDAARFARASQQMVRNALLNSQYDPAVRQQATQLSANYNQMLQQYLIQMIQNPQTAVPGLDTPAQVPGLAGSTPSVPLGDISQRGANRGSGLPALPGPIGVNQSGVPTGSPAPRQVVSPATVPGGVNQLDVNLQPGAGRTPTTPWVAQPTTANPGNGLPPPPGASQRNAGGRGQ